MDSFKSQVAKLRAQGHPNKAIAEKLGVSFTRVMEAVSQLVAEGEVQSRWPKARWTEKGSKDFKRVVQLLQSGANLAEIGEAFGVSRERARQIREKIRKRYGDQIVQPRKQPLITLREAARELNTAPGPLQRLLRKSGLLTKSRRGVWLVRRSDLKRKAVTQHPYITQEQVCKYCGKKFPLRHRAQKVCSSQCGEARRKDARLKCFESEPSPDNLAGWHKDLWLRLQRHRPPQLEEWLTLGQASARCGLTPIQVNWLRLRKVLSCQPSDTQFWRNQPVQLYRASEMEIVRQCREALLRSESR